MYYTCIICTCINKGYMYLIITSGITSDIPTGSIVFSPSPPSVVSTSTRMEIHVHIKLPRYY